MAFSRFNSFIMGGFEGSTHIDRSGRRLDLVASTRHDEFAFADYSRAVNQGLRTVRDCVRWHLIEVSPFEYDFSSLERQVQAANEVGIEVIWDYFHYGYPNELDIFSEQFRERFAAFSTAVTRYLAGNYAMPLHICPVNEISFFAWIAANKGHFAPCVTRRDNELKDQLIATSLESVRAIRQAAPDVTIMFTEPAIHVVPRDDSPYARRAAEAYRRSQFQALDRLQAAANDDLGINDVIGLNYYFHNQWRHPSRRKIHRDHPQYRPLSEILAEFYDRYRLPLLIAETGIEDDLRAEWFRYVCDEVAVAIEYGIPIEGICLYPIVNHPGWADDRHCYNGLWDYADAHGDRETYLPLSIEIERQIRRFEELFKDQKALAAG
jgi:beta-glucosidase/6-phospho-beta-glucosidase/beta-galactosidase